MEPMPGRGAPARPLRTRPPLGRHGTGRLPRAWETLPPGPRRVCGRGRRAGEGAEKARTVRRTDAGLGRPCINSRRVCVFMHAVVANSLMAPPDRPSMAENRGCGCPLRWPQRPCIAGIFGKLLVRGTRFSTQRADASCIHSGDIRNPAFLPWAPRPLAMGAPPACHGRSARLPWALCSPAAPPAGHGRPACLPRAPRPLAMGAPPACHGRSARRPLRPPAMGAPPAGHVPRTRDPARLLPLDFRDCLDLA